MRAAAAFLLALAIVPAPTAHAAFVLHHRAVKPGTAGFVETVALRIPAGPRPRCVGDALPCQGAQRLGGAFVGRDGRLYVWDEEWANVKIVSFGADGRATLAVTPAWPGGVAPASIEGGDADSLGNVALVSAATPGDIRRVYAWSPGADAWTSRDETGNGTATYEPARPRADALGRHLLHDGTGAIVIADTEGRALASMAEPARLGWKRLRFDGDLLEPAGSLLALYSTSRGLVVHRLIPQLPDEPALRSVRGAAARPKVARPKRHVPASITG